MTLLQGLEIVGAVLAGAGLAVASAAGLVCWAFSDYPLLDEGCQVETGATARR